MTNKPKPLKVRNGEPEGPTVSAWMSANMVNPLASIFRSKSPVIFKTVLPPTL